MENLKSLFQIENSSAANQIEADRAANTSYGVLPSDIYDGVVKYAYMDKSQGGTPCVKVVLEVNGKIIEETHYIAYKDTGKPYKTVNGKTITFPGMQVFNSLGYVTKGIMGTELKMEEKVIKKYNWQTKSEVPTKVSCFSELINAKLKVGIKELLKHKVQKMPDGSYVPTTEIKSVNVVDKYYSVDGKTAQEIAGNAPAEYGPNWVNAYKGKKFEEKLKVDPIDVSSQATPFDTEPAAPNTLFGD